MVTVLLSLSLASLAQEASTLQLWCAAGYIALSLFVHGYLLERRGSGSAIEMTRLIVAIGLSSLLPLAPFLANLLLSASAASLLLLAVSLLLKRNLLNLPTAGVSSASAATDPAAQ